MSSNRTSPRNVPIAQFWLHWWAVSSICFAILAGIVYGGWWLSIIMAMMMVERMFSIILILLLIIVPPCIGLIGKIQLNILKNYLHIQGSWVKPIILAAIIGLIIAGVLTRNNTIFQTGGILREAGVYRELVTRAERLALDRTLTYIIRGQQISLAFMGAISIVQWLFLRKYLKRAIWLLPFTVLGCLLGAYVGGRGEILVIAISIILAVQAAQATALMIALYQEQSPSYARMIDVGSLAVIVLLAVAIAPVSWIFSPTGQQTLEQRGQVALEQVRHSSVSDCVTQASGEQPVGFNLMVAGFQPLIAEESAPLNLLSDAVRPGHTDRINGMAIHPNGRHLITSSSDTIKFWDIYCGEEVLTIGVDRTWANGAPDGPVAITPDGTKLVSGGRIRGTPGVKVWDIAAEKELLFIEMGRNVRAITAVAISADGKRIVAGSEEQFFVWEAETGEMLLEAVNHTDYIYDVAITPDRNWAVSFGYDGLVSVWDLNRYQLYAAFRGVDNPSIITGRISPDGQKLVMGDRSGNLRVWALLTGEEQYAVSTAPVLWLEDLAITQDGKYVVTVANDQTRVWLLETGEEIASFADPSVQMVRITPDDRYILTISHRGELRVWEMPGME